MNPGEVWRLDEGGGLRLVLSNATYNVSGLNRVITAVVTTDAAGSFDPFAVACRAGVVRADRIAMHPRTWLKEPVSQLTDEQYAAVREHLQFLFDW